MSYAEASFAGPDTYGRTFAAHFFHHIAAWQEWRRLRAIERATREAAR